MSRAADDLNETGAAPAGLTALAAGFGPPIQRDGVEVRPARPAEFPALAALRGRAFRDGAEDRDAFDARCLHLWIGRPGAQPLATIRLQPHPPGDLSAGYAAACYDLAPLAAAPGPALELGRLCLAPGEGHADLVRLVWAGVTRVVETGGFARLVGCVSLKGADPAPHVPALALLALRHLGPPEHRPRRRAPEVFGFDTLHPIRPSPADLALLPPLLRAYLSLGGWVSDHLVIDRDLGTCHVFTCVEIATMPEGRKRLFRALAGG